MITATKCDRQQHIILHCTSPDNGSRQLKFTISAFCIASRHCYFSGSYSEIYLQHEKLISDAQSPKQMVRSPIIGKMMASVGRLYTYKMSQAFTTMRRPLYPRASHFEKPKSMSCRRHRHSIFPCHLRFARQVQQICHQG